MLRLGRSIVAALALALLSIASAVAAQFVVIYSTSPDLPAGAIVEGTRLVSIAEGERVTLVPEDGNTRIIRGPFNGALEDKQEARAKNSGMIQILAKFVASDQSRTIAAVVRGETTAALEEPFLLPIGVGGRFCVRHGSVTLCSGDVLSLLSLLSRPRPVEVVASV